MSQQILVPDIGDYTNVEIVGIAAKEGSHLKQEDPIITIETDKATMDIPVPYNLTIVKLHVKMGDRVSKGSLIATVNPDVGHDIKDQKQNVGSLQQDLHHNSLAGSSQQGMHGNSSSQLSQAGKANEGQHHASPKLSQAAGKASERSCHASPSVRKFARELGLELENIAGTGKNNRIVEHDVKQYVHDLLAKGAINSKSNVNISNVVNIDFSKWGTVSEQPLSRIKKKSGQNLHRNWVSIPHVTHFDEVDLTELELFRTEQQQLAIAQGFKLTPLTFFIKAIISGLKQYPNFNSSLSADGEHLIIKHYYNIGIAVDTENGLVVPVIKNADQKSLFQLASELAVISQKARDHKLSSDDLQGGCFTISSLGGISGVGFTPIINSPEVAILGVSKSKIRPIYVNGSWQPRLILPFALSYDHRVIDGAEAARFTKFIAEQLVDPKKFYE